MRRFALLAGLVALAALASPPVFHLTREQCFLGSLSDGGNAAGQVTRDSLSRGIELQNQGSTTLWCAQVNQADALVNHSRSIAAGGTWAVDTAANVAIWCVAGGGIDQQSSLDGGANGTADGGPAGCTIVNNAH